MNKKKVFLVFGVLIILVVALVITVIISSKSTLATTDNNYTIKEANVENQTIIKEFTSSMEVSSGLVEKIELHATYYFEELCVEKNTYIKEGTKILKYTNGTYLKAPYDLVVTNYLLPESSELCKNSHYIEVQTTETLVASIEINESDMEFISLGKEVEITLNAFEETKYKGYVTDISETATNSKFTGTVTFLNDGNIKLGMSGSCTIVLQEAKDVVVVPIEAVETRENTKYVIVVGNDTETKEVEVETGISNSNYVEIKNGLKIGQTVQYIDVATGKTGTSNTSSTNTGQRDGSAAQIVRMIDVRD